MKTTKIKKKEAMKTIKPVADKCGVTKKELSSLIDEISDIIERQHRRNNCIIL